MPLFLTKYRLNKERVTGCCPHRIGVIDQDMSVGGYEKDIIFEKKDK